MASRPRRRTVVVTHRGHVASDALEMPLTRAYKSGTIRILVRNHHNKATITGGSSPKLCQVNTFPLQNINIGNGHTYMTPTTNKRDDHFLGVVFNEEMHGNLSFGSFGRRYAVKANYLQQVARPFRYTAVTRKFK